MIFKDAGAQQRVLCREQIKGIVSNNEIFERAMESTGGPLRKTVDLKCYT